MPASSQTITYQDGGKTPRLTAFDTAVIPTSSDSHSRWRPMLSTMSLTVLMPPFCTTGASGQDHNSIIEPSVQSEDYAPVTDRPDYSEIGERLAQLRSAMSEPQKKSWALKHGFQVTQYQHWEKGSRRIPIDAAERLCDRYGLTLDWIYRGRADGLPASLRNVL